LRPFGNGSAFCPEPVELRNLAVRGAGVTILSGGVGLALQVVGTAVLARLLAPRDFGLIAMATTFSVLLANCGLNGLTEVVIQRDKIDHDLASTLFWINLSAGVLLTVGFAACGTLLAWFYHDAKVRMVAIAISPTILLTSSSVLHLALLKRAMRFHQLSVNDIVARTVSVTVAILLGWAGYRYWALVAGALVLPASVAIGAWSLCWWIPGRPRRVAGTKSALRFAIQTYARFSFGYITRNTDNLLIGWRFSAQALGFYKKAYDLFLLSANQLVASTTDVALSALSRVKRDSAYQRYFVGVVSIMAFVGMGLSAELTLTGKDLIRLLLGPNWEPAGTIFTFFGPGIGVMILYYTHSWIHLSIGRADRWFRWGIVEFAVTLLLFIAGLPAGPAGIALAWTVSFWILTIPALWYAGKPIGLRVGPMLSVVWRYLGAALISGGVTGLAIRKIQFVAAAPGAVGAWIRVIAISTALTVLYLTAVVLLHGGFKPISDFGKLMRGMLPWNRTPWQTPAASEHDSWSVAPEQSEAVRSPQAGPKKVLATCEER
jgi:PST family polysaccharide transporter